MYEKSLEGDAEKDKLQAKILELSNAFYDLNFLTMDLSLSSSKVSESSSKKASKSKLLGSSHSGTDEVDRIKD